MHLDPLRKYGLGEMLVLCPPRRLLGGIENEPGHSKAGFEAIVPG